MVEDQEAHGLSEVTCEAPLAYTEGWTKGMLLTVGLVLGLSFVTAVLFLDIKMKI